MKRILLFFLCFLPLLSCKSHGQVTTIPNTEEFRDVICYQEDDIQICAGHYGGYYIQFEY